MAALLIVLLLALVLAGSGFALHLLWIFAVIVLFLWVLGFAFRTGTSSWYRW